jgi:uncharacterized protein (DUF1501 family)
MNRRLFLKSSACALGMGSFRAAFAAGTPSKKVLIAIFQRGAVDGLSVVVPHGDRNYAALRPNIAVKDSIDLDGFFGLHPALAPLKPIYDAKQLAVVHAVGSPDPTR